MGLLKRHISGTVDAILCVNDFRTSTKKPPSSAEGNKLFLKKGTCVRKTLPSNMAMAKYPNCIIQAQTSGRSKVAKGVTSKTLIILPYLICKRSKIFVWADKRPVILLYFCPMKICIELFFTFMKIGAFTLGGGYAMLSMVEKAVVDQKKWIASDEFWDMIAVIQSLPGVFAVNTALYVGQKVAGRRGAFASMLGAILPSIVIILLLATVFREFRENPVVERIFKGIRPCVVALILAPSLRMIQSAKVTWKTAIIPIAAVVLIFWCKVSPAYVILAAIVGSVVYAFVADKRGKEAPK